jgi:hypothetical protein
MNGKIHDRYGHSSLITRCFESEDCALIDVCRGRGGGGGGDRFTITVLAVGQYQVSIRSTNTTNTNTLDLLALFFFLSVVGRRPKPLQNAVGKNSQRFEGSPKTGLLYYYSTQ